LSEITARMTDRARADRSTEGAGADVSGGAGDWPSGVARALQALEGLVREGEGPFRSLSLSLSLSLPL
jgi:hypothetical protein